MYLSMPNTMQYAVLPPGRGHMPPPRSLSYPYHPSTVPVHRPGQGRARIGGDLNLNPMADIEEQTSYNAETMLSEPIIPPIAGYPDVNEFDELVRDYVGGLSPKKQDKALIHARRAANILAVLVDKKTTAVESAQFRVPKELISRFVKLCPTCKVRRGQNRGAMQTPDKESPEDYEDCAETCSPGNPSRHESVTTKRSSTSITSPLQMQGSSSLFAHQNRWMTTSQPEDGKTAEGYHAGSPGSRYLTQDSIEHPNMAPSSMGPSASMMGRSDHSLTFASISSGVPLSALAQHSAHQITPSIETRSAEEPIGTRSCAGISFKSQALYFIVYVTRYLDIFSTFTDSAWNTVFKIIFLASSGYTLYVMLNDYKPTHDPNVDTFKVEYLLGGAAILAILFPIQYTLSEIFWAFSIWLESVAILPQLFMLQRTGEAETITTHYLFALGLYRALYIPNWIYRYFAEGWFEPRAVVAGIIQTILYSDFFWIYYTK
ncbi:hypothetical protein DV738_g3695, partial [Chaetothyriales sp. CBS 135597]